MTTRPKSDFHAEANALWAADVKMLLGRVPPNVQTWEVLADMQHVFAPFMGQNKNHAYYPTGGGMDFLSCQMSREQGCLDFMVGERTATVVCPSALTLDYFPQAPEESFFFLELAELAPSDVYQTSVGMSEELVELQPGKFVDRGVWDNGFYGHDEDGREMPLSSDARLVVRRFRGGIVLVSKGSLWNNTPKTYDGSYNALGRHGVRQIISTTL